MLVMRGRVILIHTISEIYGTFSFLKLHNTYLQRQAERLRPVDLHEARLPGVPQTRGQGRHGQRRRRGLPVSRLQVSLKFPIPLI